MAQNLTQRYPYDLVFRLAPKTEEAVFLHPKVSALDLEPIGPFVRTQGGQLLTMNPREALISNDECKQWQSVSVFKTTPHQIEATYSICSTQTGAIVVGFMDVSNGHFRWRKKTNLPTKNTRLHLWSVRSLDGGQTWEAPVLVQKGYCGATTTLIQLSNGRLIMAAQSLDYDRGRHVSLTYFSDDDGQSWQASNLLDIGGQGHHDGCFEGSLVALENGKILNMIRTNRGWFWNAFSEDQGESWTEVQPGLEAPSAPGMLLRLQSGRILLAYNPLVPLTEQASSQKEVKLVSGFFSQKPVSWQREEVAIRWSEDEGKSWSEPVALAVCKKAWLSYCQLFEVRPGEVWLTTMQSELKLRFFEQDFLP